MPHRKKKSVIVLTSLTAALIATIHAVLALDPKNPRFD
jgi:hypothetical protein